MLFTSGRFLLIFFPLFLALCSFLPRRWLLPWITLASFAFYTMEGQPWFLIPLILTVCWDFCLGIKMEEAKTSQIKTLILIVSLLGNMGLLIFFKYGKFLINSLGIWLPQIQVRANTSWLIKAWGFALPAGLSFYSFQTLSYMVDIYRGTARAEKNFWKFASFVSFFPHLVAGPLTRHRQLIPALEKISEEGIHIRWEEGIYLFAVGLCKKYLLADRLGEMVDFFLLNPVSLGFVSAWLCIFGFALQIYFDFSAYTDMAIGLGRLVGVELPQNFNRPYTALNPGDFWRRWHMTLSSWLRDYLFIPICIRHSSTIGQLMSLLITMFLGGLWHGARWTFAIWGLYHGLLLVVYHTTKTYWDRWPNQIQQAVTLILISFGWIFFRAETLQIASWWTHAALGYNGWMLGSLDAFQIVLPFMVLGGMGWLIWPKAPVASQYSYFKGLPDGHQFVLGALTVLAILYINQTSRFLYFQF